MSLTDLWTGDRSQLEGKQIHQIIAFAGDGKLRDGSTASRDFREFLGHIPSSLLTQYLNQCLSESFKDSGLALQDIVNEIGRRLGFQVTDGRYRGSVGYVGCDGIWRFPKGHTVIVEVKTTDVYQIDLDKLAKYRRDLVTGGEISEDESSVLIVIGRQDRDTTGVEAQIRGSRHAWDIRLISVDALVRLMSLKEEVEDPQIIRRISEILIPREFTKLDEIIELVFSTAEDIKEEQPGEEPDETESHDKTNGAVVRVAFYDACLKHIEQRLKVSLIKRSRTIYSTPDNTLGLVLVISKPYHRGEQTTFWFAFHPHQQDMLGNSKHGYVALGCGSEKTIVLVPWADFSGWLDQMPTTENEQRYYWHVNISKDGNKLTLHRKRGVGRIDLVPYLIR